MCESHTCLSHKIDLPSQQNVTGTIELFSKFIIYTEGKNLTFKIVYSIDLGGSKKNEIENQHKKNDKLIKPTKLIFRFGGLWDVVISACDTLLTHTVLFKDGARKHKRRIERRIFCGTRPFGLNMTFHACDK